MKVRTDFVTNSSSSSFIIAMTNDEKHKGIIDALVNATDYRDTNEGTKISTLDELNSYFVEERGYESETIHEILERSNYTKNQYEKSLTEINNGKTIIIKDIGYSADALIDFIHILKENDNDIVILAEEND